MYYIKIHNDKFKIEFYIIIMTYLIISPFNLIIMSFFLRNGLSFKLV